MRMTWRAGEAGEKAVAVAARRRMAPERSIRVAPAIGGAAAARRRIDRLRFEAREARSSLPYCTPSERANTARDATRARAAGKQGVPGLNTTMLV